MIKTVKRFVINDVLHWVWKLLPLIFACGILWNKVDNVGRLVDKLTERVMRLENCMMEQGRH